MDSMIPLGQKNTLAEYMILSGADNRPPMLDKDLYDSWKEKGEFIHCKNRVRKNDLELVDNQVLQSDSYSLEIITEFPRIYGREFNYWCKSPPDDGVAYQSPQIPTQLMTESSFVDSGFVVLVFSPRDDSISCLNKAMAFLTAVALSRVIVQQVQGRQGQHYSGNTYKSNATSLRGNTTSGHARVVKCYNCQAGQILDEEQLAFLADPGIPADQAQTIIPHNAAFQTENIDTYDSDCDDLSTAQAVLMTNVSNYGSDVISEAPNSKTYLNDMDNQSVHALQDFEQSPATVQDTNLQAQQDSMILSVIEQMSEQMINHVNNWEKANKEQNNESITAELERYKERVKTFEQRLNIDLSSREKMIDSQMDDMIREKLALKEQIDSLEQNLSKQIKEKESLFKTFTVFKNESKEKENKYMENEIDLEKKIKELDNIVYKVGQSTQTVHMLTKPQAFYDNTHKQALGYQNPFYLRKAQRIKPTLYDGAVISKTHVAMPVIDDEETLILEEESRSKMFEKAKDPEVIAKKISHKPIDYEKLNSLIEDFETRFSPQQELSAEQAFWFHTFNPTIEPSYSPPVIVDVPSELPKVSLVNASLKKLKFHLTQFDSVVKKRTTPSALEEEYFEINDLKAQLQDKDTTISKLKDTIKSLKKNTKEKNVNHDKCDLEPINEELENSMAKLLLENERLCNEIKHVKQVFKDQFDSIKQTRVRHKEQCDSLINKLNLKYVENKDLKAQIQDKVFVITSLKNDLRKSKGKEIFENVVHIPSATTIALGMFKLDLVPLPPSELDLACKYATRIQELLVYVQDTCPNAMTPSAKKVTVKPMNNVKKVRFAEPLTSSSKIQQVESSNTSDSNIYVLSSTGVKYSTSNCGSKPLGNKKNDKISQTPSRNKKNKLEAQPRKVNKMNHVVKPVCDVDVKQSLSNANSDILCATCNKSMFDGVHDKCLLDLVQNGNNHAKSAKKHKKQNIWKHTGHVFTEVGFKWKPTGRTFTIVGNSCPLTRITSTNVVPPKQTTSHSDEIQKPKIKVYSRKPKNVKNIGSSKIAKIVESKNANHSEPNQIWGSTAIDIPSSSSLVMTGTVRFRNDQIAKIMGYGDYQLGNVIISRVYYVEGLGHNLFSVGQFFDVDLEVVFWKNTCFIRNLEGVDLLSGSRDTILYIISLDDMLKSSPICLLSKASKTKSWLWHHQLSHLNFSTLNKLAKDGLVRGIPRLKF
ncbi:retrovirus-related pol polyprotein from transposon TNT 1-94 [Tanacetum coccineum]